MDAFPLQLQIVSDLRPTKYEISWFCFCILRAGILINLREHFAYKDYSVTCSHKPKTFNEAIFPDALFF